MTDFNKWDYRFMARAKEIANWSKDPDHKVGAVITDLDNFSIGEGFNGPPQYSADRGMTREAQVFRTLHAEVNALLRATKHPHLARTGTTLYVYPLFPCCTCAAMMIQLKITRIICMEQTTVPVLSSWERSQEEAARLMRECDVQLLFMEEYDGL